MVFSKFKDKSKKNKVIVKGAPTPEHEGPVRVKLPRENQVIGIISQRVGGGRMLVSCMDGKTRNCKVPGRLRRGMWLREDDVVIVEPWEFDNEKGGIMFKYSKAAIDRLKKMGKLETDNSEF